MITMKYRRVVLQLLPVGLHGQLEAAVRGGEGGGPHGAAAGGRMSGLGMLQHVGGPPKLTKTTGCFTTPNTHKFWPQALNKRELYIWKFYKGSGT